MFSFQHIKKVPLFDIQNDSQEVVATNPKPLEVPDTRAGPGSSSLQKDPVNRLENYNVPERQAEFQDASTSLQKQTRSRLVIVETSQKSAEKKERPSLNKTQTKDSKEIPAASQNHAKTLVETQSSNKDGKRITPAANKKGETKKYIAPGNEEKEKAKAKRVTPVPPRKQSAGKAAKQPQFHDKNATLPSTANQTHLRKQSNKINLIKEHSAKASVSDVQQVTHPAPLATTPKRLKAADFKSEPRWKFDDIYLLDNSTPPSVSNHLHDLTIHFLKKTTTCFCCNTHILTIMFCDIIKQGVGFIMLHDASSSLHLISLNFSWKPYIMKAHSGLQH